MNKALIVGASRGIGLGLVKELAHRQWSTVGTVRQGSQSELEAFATANPALNVTTATVDITLDQTVTDLQRELAEQRFDLILVNAGIAPKDVPVSEMPASEFSRVMLTNAFAPVRFIERMAPLLNAHGTLAVTFSRQGSVSLNVRGGDDVYRASKAALNQLVRSYGASSPQQALLLLHPGWVQTDLGRQSGQAPLTVEQSASGLADVIERHLGEPGVWFRDYQDQIVPW
ncbi:SDR family NAD(P)-dependent oxidoreductase [Furfurilactobacillus sp. WILCCON 0119]